MSDTMSAQDHTLPCTLTPCDYSPTVLRSHSLGNPDLTPHQTITPTQRSASVCIPTYQKLNSPSDGRATPAGTHPRRLSRKLPPALTESLVNLASLTTPALTPSTSQDSGVTHPLVTGHSPSGRVEGSSQDKMIDHPAILSQTAVVSSQFQFQPRTHRLASASGSASGSASPTRRRAPSDLEHADPGHPMHEANKADRKIGQRYVLEVAPPLPPKDGPSGPSPSSSASHFASHRPLATTSRHPSISSTASSSSSANTHAHRMGYKKSSSSSANSDILMTPHLGSSKSPFAFITRGHHSRPSTDSSLQCSSGPASTCGTWSLYDEIQLADNLSSSSLANGSRSYSTRSGLNLYANGKKETRTERKERIKREKESFDEDRNPSPKELFEASLLEVIDEHGHKKSFGDLVRNRRTIVIFIRHWFCPLCAQYMNSIMAEVSPDALEEAGVDLIIIGNGSNKMLDGYRNKAFRCPFKMYTDPTLALYRALGLTRQTADAGAEEDKGDYLVQTAMQSTVQTLKRATKMPLRNPGHFTQLGGEFVFDGTLNVTYTHRMTNTRSHAPIRDICAEAGVRLEFIHYEPGPPPPPVHRHSVVSASDDSHETSSESDQQHAREEVVRANEWQKERDETLSRMRAMKSARREGFKSLEGQGTLCDKRSRVGLETVRIVGQDLEEDEVVHGFSSLALGVHA
ncbi:hypothetical protein IAU60_004282 [Kwoniella sp. DSM 27419]